jgi:hypothetical protein
MKNLLTIWFLIIVQVAFAQKSTFTGTIQNDKGEALELANVMALEKATGKIGSFGVTDHLGRYVLKLYADTTYILKSSYMGYETFEREIVPSSAEQPFSIRLNPSDTQLDAVEIVEEFPVVITGDTITYKADAFTDGNERKLEDVLKDLPGFEVDENGEISVQGEKVEKVLVEGKEFFDGDTKMATKNLPANAVDKVQLLRNYNEVSPMSSLSSEDRMALNIKLKDGKKNLWFGDVYAGAGPDSRYVGHTNAFYYTPKLNLNVIADANTIGEPAFTARDYFRFSGGLRNLGSRTGSTITLGGTEAAFISANARSAVDIDSKLAAVNFNYVPGNAWKFSGFAIGSTSGTLQRTTSQRTFLRQQGQVSEDLETENQQELGSLLTKFSTTYTPNAALFIETGVILKYANREFEQVQQSNFEGIENTIFSPERQQPFSWKQNLNLFYAKSENDLFSMEASYEYTKDDPVNLYQSGRLLFPGLFSEAGQDSTLISQDQRRISQSGEAMVNYYRVLNRTNHLNLLAGANISRQNLSNGITSGFSETQDSSTSLKVDDIYGGVGYKTKLGKLVFHPRFLLHHYLYTVDSESISDQTSLVQLTPDILLDYDINSAQNVRLSYNQQVQFFDVMDVMPFPVIQNFNSAMIGNTTLEPALFHRINLNYRNFSMFSGINAYGGASYQRKIRDLSNRIEFIGQNRVLQPFNISAVNEMLTGFGNFTKTFRKWKFTVAANYSFSRFFNEVEGRLFENESFNQTYRAEIETRLFEKVIWSVNSRVLINDYTGDRTASTFTTFNPGSSLNISLGDFELDARYSYFGYQNADRTVQTSYDFLDLELSFQQEESPWRFSLIGNNLTDTQIIRRDSFRDNLISTSSQFVQPAIGYVKVQYDF